MYRGDYFAGDTVYFKFTTQNSYGVPATLSGTPAIRVYKNGSDVEDDSGITLTADFDSRTGLNHVAIDTSSDGTFYAAGNDFQVVITTGTVDSQSVVGYVVGEFSLENRTALSTSQTGDAVLDEVVEGSYTVRQYLRLMAAALAGKLSGAATATVTIRDTGDSKDRVVATVDGDGNRTAVTLDVS